MSTREASELLKKLEKANVELFLWHGAVACAKGARFSKSLVPEIPRLLPYIRKVLTLRNTEDRAKPGPHKWLLQRSDGKRPAFLACGPVEWYERGMRAAMSLSKTEAERNAWVVLDQEHVGTIVRSDGIGSHWLATLTLPEGWQPAGPKGTEVQIVDACESCLHPGIPIEELNNIVKPTEPEGE
jgi:hypothetical protein